MTHQQKDPSIRPKKPVWFYELRDQAVGPVDEPALRRAAREGDLTRGTLVWRKSLDGWQPATAVPEVLALIEQEADVVRTASEPRGFEPGPDAVAPQTQSRSPAVDDQPSSEAPVSSRPSPVLAASSPAAEPAPAEPSSCATPPAKSCAPELTDEHGLGDAISEEEELERPIREADVRELLERARSSHPSPGPASLPPSEPGAALQPRRSSVSAPSASERAPASGQLDTGPAPTPARPLPLWAKTTGVAALFLLGMGAVLLTGRPRGAAETTAAESAGPSGGGQSRLGSTKVDAARRATDSVRPSSPVPPRAAGPVEPGGTPPVVITEGPLPPKIFQKLLDNATPMFDEQCWQKLRAAEGEVAEHPSISIELGVSAWGQLDKLAAGEAPAGYRGVGRCIMGRIRGWRFPRASARTLATLRISPAAE